MREILEYLKWCVEKVLEFLRNNKEKSIPMLVITGIVIGALYILQHLYPETISAYQAWGGAYWSILFFALMLSLLLVAPHIPPQVRKWMGVLLGMILVAITIPDMFRTMIHGGVPPSSAEGAPLSVLAPMLTSAPSTPVYTSQTCPGRMIPVTLVKGVPVQTQSLPLCNMPVKLVKGTVRFAGPFGESYTYTEGKVDEKKKKESMVLPPTSMEALSDTAQVIYSLCPIGSRNTTLDCKPL